VAAAVDVKMLFCQTGDGDGCAETLSALMCLMIYCYKYQSPRGDGGGE
jgi:hypothetical protein